MSVTLVSFATGKHRPRQEALHFSARCAGSAERGEKWGVRRLLAGGFREACPEIRLGDSGVGFWAWKPFIILEGLRNVADGNFVLYCDVGRTYPWKMLDRRIDALVAWMDARGQDVFPGVRIPWHGPMSRWTKRSAFRGTDSDAPRFHEAIPIQASFSLWRRSPKALRLAEDWLDLCRRRALVSDARAEDEHEPLPGFRSHRHDQSLWTILCLREGLEAFDAGGTDPGYDTKSPAEIARVLGEPARPLPAWFRAAVNLASRAERLVR